MATTRNKKQLQQPATAPLLCWDIFMQGYWKKIALADDKLTLNRMAGRDSWREVWDLELLLLQESKVIIVTDPLLQIVFASSNITDMNGYSVEEIKGKTPAIFQGKDTDRNIRTDISHAVRERRKFDVSLINYKKNGEPYHCNIQGSPVFNKKNQLVNFIAFETAAYYDY